MLHELLLRVAQEIDQAPPVGREFDQPMPLVERLAPGLQAAVAAGQLDAPEIEGSLASYRSVRPESFNYCDAASDLLRAAAGKTGDTPLATRAAEEHCRVLLAAAESLFDAAAGDCQHEFATRSLKIGVRAKRILDSFTGLQIDPSLKLGAELATGRVYAYPGSRFLYLTIPAYLRAAHIMKQQGWQDQYRRIMAKLVSMANYIVQTTAGGSEYSLMSVDEAARAAEEAADVPLMERVAIARVRAYRTANLFDDAERFAREALAARAIGDSSRDQLRFELALCLGGRQGSSQTGRQNRAEIAEAADILENLLASHTPATATPEDRRVALLNLATLHAVLGDRERAAREYAECHRLFAESRDPANEVLLLIQWGRCLIESGNAEEGRRRVLQAEAILEQIEPASFGTHFQQYAGLAYCWHELGDLEHASQIAAAAQDLYEQEIDRLVDPALWKGIYTGFHRLDSYIVEAAIKRARSRPCAESLLRMEGSKARTITRLRALVNRNQHVTERAERVKLLQERIDGVLAWTAEQPARAMVSLFMGYRGLGVAVVRNGELSQAWLDDFDEMAFIKQIFDPIPQLISRGFAGDDTAFSAASALADSALAQIGEAVWRCMPGLTGGGSELLLVPHRLMRAFPVMHVRLPGGKRLSELFHSVSVLPSMYLPGVDTGSSGQTAITGVADSHSDLLMARFEALRACRGGSCATGESATTQQLEHALNESGTVIIACHGTFDKVNPFHSVLLGYDGGLSVWDLFVRQDTARAGLIYLSACESGMDDVSLSDDPVGFAGLFSYTGARAVVAPLWQVDDFTALLFSDAFFREISNGTGPSRSTLLASGELRRLSVTETLHKLSGFRAELAEMVAQGKIARAESEHVEGRFRSLEAWLETLQSEQRPFNRLLDWGAYQCHSNPFTNTEEIHAR